MIHVLEHPQFPIRSLSMDGGLERPGQLLDGDFQAASVLLHCLGVGGAADLWFGRDKERVFVRTYGHETLRWGTTARTRRVRRRYDRIHMAFALRAISTAALSAPVFDHGYIFIHSLIPN